MQAKNRGRVRLSVSCRGNMVRYFLGRVSEYPSIRLVYDKTKKHIPDQCVATPIPMHTKLALLEGLHDSVGRIFLRMQLLSGNGN